MSRRLLLINAALLLVALAAVGSIVRTVTEPETTPVVTRKRPPAPASGNQPPTRPPLTGGAAAYSIVATRNLFNPTRTEGQAGTTPGVAVALLPRPNLHGVVLTQGASIAYLEDPSTKRVAAYRLGDSIAGGTIQAINADHVILARPDGRVDLRLHDPSRPRPAAPPATGQPGQVIHPGPTMPPGQVITPGQPLQSGVVPPTQPPVPMQVPPGTVAPPPHPIIEQPGPPAPFVPGRRQLPPSLLRRVVPSAPSDAPTQ